MAPEGGGDGDRGGKEAARAELSAGWWRSLRGVLSRAPSPAVKTAAAAAAAAAARTATAAPAAGLQAFRSASLNFVTPKKRWTSRIFKRR